MGQVCKETLTFSRWQAHSRLTQATPYYSSVTQPVSDIPNVLGYLTDENLDPVAPLSA